MLVKYYLELKPDFVSSGIKYEFGDYIEEPEEISIPEELFLKAKNFNKKYRRIISMGTDMRKAHYDLIYNLDVEGYNLKMELENIARFSVKYFSEGLLRYLFDEPRIEDYKVRLNVYLKILRWIDLLFYPRSN